MPYQNQKDKTKPPYQLRLSSSGPVLHTAFEWDSTETRLIFWTIMDQFQKAEDMNYHWQNSKNLWGFTKSLLPWFSYTPGPLFDLCEWLITDLNDYYERGPKSGRIAHIEMKINQACYEMWADMLLKNCGEKSQTYKYLLEEFEKFGISVQNPAISTSS